MSSAFSGQPASLSIVSDIETPVSVFYQLSQAYDSQPAFLFESTEPDSRLARFSFIGINPLKVLSVQDGQLRIEDTVTGQNRLVPVKNLMHQLETELQETRQALGMQALGMQSQSVTALNTAFPFTGGMVGYLGYGCTQYFEGITPQQSQPFCIPNRPDFKLPEAYWGIYDTVVLFDHLYRRIVILSYRGEAKVQEVLEKLSSAGQAQTALQPLRINPDELPEAAVFQNVSSNMSPEDFKQRVETAKGWIREGQVFQIVPSQRFSRPVNAEPLSVYRLLQAVNPSPYAYYLKYPGFSYLGSSPETFVQVKQANNQVTLRALAGTRPRGLTPEEDASLEAELKQNVKELAEHHMLVDLGRNDLGKVCQPGSVRVQALATVTHYTHVMHLTSEITGMLRPDKTAFEVLQGCFPRGTVSGAPKIRAMQLLSQLEPDPRGIYSGFVGYFDWHGNMDGAIAIRSALILELALTPEAYNRATGDSLSKAARIAHVQAGAGVVFDSDPEAEYEETRNKAKSVLKAIALAESLQSIC